MVTRGDTVQLKDWKFGRRIRPKKGIDTQYSIVPDTKRQECYMTLYGSEKDCIYMEDINSELEKMSRYLLSDRVRTLKNKPQFKVINGITERIQ